jgi:hypothetical protein
LLPTAAWPRPGSDSSGRSEPAAADPLTGCEIWGWSEVFRLTSHDRLGLPEVH